MKFLDMLKMANKSKQGHTVHRVVGNTKQGRQLLAQSNRDVIASGQRDLRNAQFSGPESATKGTISPPDIRQNNQGRNS